MKYLSRRTNSLRLLLLSREIPIMFLAQQPPEGLTKASDLKRVIVSLPSDSWLTLRGMELPINVADIFSIAPAYNIFGEGLFVLCAIKSRGMSLYEKGISSNTLHRELAIVAEFIDNSE
jgi:hypothetical protein